MFSFKDKLAFICYGEIRNDNLRPFLNEGLQVSILCICFTFLKDLLLSFQLAWCWESWGSGSTAVARGLNFLDLNLISPHVYPPASQWHAGVTLVKWARDMPRSVCWLCCVFGWLLQKVCGRCCDRPPGLHTCDTSPLWILLRQAVTVRHRFGKWQIKCAAGG